jgi:hypothetical protein
MLNKKRSFTVDRQWNENEGDTHSTQRKHPALQARSASISLPLAEVATARAQRAGGMTLLLDLRARRATVLLF